MEILVHHIYAKLDGKVALRFWAISKKRFSKTDRYRKYAFRCWCIQRYPISKFLWKILPYWEPFPTPWGAQKSAVLTASTFLSYKQTQKPKHNLLVNNTSLSV